jgi:hypothetical protein
MRGDRQTSENWAESGHGRKGGWEEIKEKEFLLI